MPVRRYEGVADLRDMQAAAQRIWSPTSRWHIGDLAWGWVELPGNLDLLADPAHLDLASEVLRWFHQVATTEHYTVTVLDGGHHLIEALVSMGYQPQVKGPLFTHSWMSLTGGLPSQELPERFVLRHVQETDIEQRVRVHQAVLSPSRVTTESYTNVMNAWPYRADLDWVIEAPNGELVSFALAWLDDVNRVGELEPVGTDPTYRGLGLGRATSLAALHALKNAGAESAVVYPRGDDAYPIPMRLYGGMGFVSRAHTVTYVR
jgi:ribosomal protein S18 acetylase RimI-like enzyme